MTKSHVSMEAAICPVCGKSHNTGAILLDKRLRASMEPVTHTGYAMCQPCDGLNKQGYIALIEVSNTGERTNLKMENANRTGRIAHLRRSVFSKVFNTTVSQDLPMVFVDKDVLDALEKMREQSTPDADNVG